MSATVNIKPQILYWAMNRANKSVDDLIKALPKLPDWLDNKSQPTVKQLETFSKKVYLPFGYLFLSEPPKEKIPFPYFRQGKKMVNNQVSINVFDTILSIQQRQQWLSEYLKEEGEQPLAFVGKYNINTTVDNIVVDIRRTLKLPVGWAREFKTQAEAVNKLISQIEETGVIVVVNGIVGNNTRRRIDAEECRGFVLVDAYAPFLFVNNTDAEAGKMFTLIHELAHVWLGKSAGFDNNKMLPADDPIEKLCDKVAAEFLVPAIDFENAWYRTQNFSVLAKIFKVSRLVIARRALDLGKMTRSAFFSWYNDWLQEWEERKGDTGGGDFYNNQPNRVSRRFAALVERAVRNEQLSYRDAYRMTGLYGDTYHNFINKKL
jgi:Zn-dependent peptidase ImmA (M78 family)